MKGDGRLKLREGKQRATRARHATWEVIRQALRRHTGLMSGWLIALILSSVVMLAMPLVVGSIVELGWDGAPLALLVFAGSLAATTALRFYCITLLGEHVAGALKRALFDRFLDQDGEFFDRNNTSELTARLTTDVAIVRMSIGAAWSVAIRTALTGLGSAIMMGLTNPAMSLVASLIAVLGALTLIYGTRRIRALALALHAHTAKTFAYASERLSSSSLVRAYVREGHEAASMRGLLRQNSQISTSLAAAGALVQAISTALLCLGLVVALRYGAYLVQQEAMSVAELTQFCLYTGILLLSAVEGAQVVAVLSKAESAVTTIGDFLSLSPTPKHPQDIVELQAMVPVVFDNVSFSYPTRQADRALTQVSFTAQPGHITVVVGASGSGKSTLFALLQRFYAPSGGSIRIGDLDVRLAGAFQTRRLLAYLPQRPAIFRMTVADNIGYSQADAKRSEIVSAARSASADGFIRELPHGYGTVLGPGGHPLSLGQEQRIGLARALVSQAPVLLMDEPTSALDAQNEQQTLSTLRSVAQGRTVILISHRLMTMQAADHIVVMHGGQVVDQGVHQDLLDRCQIYRNLATHKMSSVSNADPRWADLQGQD